MQSLNDECLSNIYLYLCAQQVGFIMIAMGLQSLQSSLLLCDFPVSVY